MSNFVVIAIGIIGGVGFWRFLEAVLGRLPTRQQRLGEQEVEQLRQAAKIVQLEKQRAADEVRIGYLEDELIKLKAKLLDAIEARDTALGIIRTIVPGANVTTTTTTTTP